MAGLTARFSLIDEMSDKIANMANAGQNMLESWEQAGTMAGSAIDGITSSATQTASTIDGVASSLNKLQSSAGSAGSSANELSEAFSQYENSLIEAAEQTENVAESFVEANEKANSVAEKLAKSADDTVKSSEESADALQKQLDMFSRCERSAEQLDNAINTSNTTIREFIRSQDSAASALEKLSDSEIVFAGTSEELTKASEAAETAIKELADAQIEADAAMDNYNAVIASGTTDLNELQLAAQRAEQAAHTLAAADEKAAAATGNLSRQTEQAETFLGELADETENVGETAEESSNKSLNAIETLSGALASAGITKAVTEIASAFMDASNKAAEFEVSLAKLSTIADTSSVSLNTISSDLLALSNDTGVAATSLTESAYQAISASVDTASAVDFVAQANELAVGGFTSTQTAVDVLSTAINAYGLEVSQAGQLSDYLITTQNLGKTSVDELAQSVGKVIPLASAYNVEMDNLSAAYAVLTANGIATAETGTYLKSMFNELADTGSDVAKILKDETGMSFSELSSSGHSLGNVLAIIGSSVNNDATAFSNLWSSSEAGVGALSLLNAGTEKYNSVLNEMQNSTGAASQAYDAMTDTTVHAQEEMANSANNLQIAIGQNLNPLIETLYEKAAQMMDKFTEFANEHPVVVKVVSAIAIGLGVAAGAIAAVTFATTIAIPAITSFGVAFNTALGPIGWIALGITAVTTAVAAFNTMFDSAEEEVEDYSGTLAECANEISMTEAALSKAKERYGENSDVVKNLESDLELLNKQYEKGGGYVADLQEQIDATAESFEKLKTAQDEAMESIDKSQSTGLQAVSMFEALMSKSEMTSVDLQTLSGYADYLNDTFNCDIVVDINTGEITGFDADAVVTQIVNQASKNRQQVALDEITGVDFTSGYLEAAQQYYKSRNDLWAAQKEFDALAATKYYDFNGNAHYANDKRYAELQTEITGLKTAANDAEINLNNFEDELIRNAEVAGLDKQSIDALVESYEEAGVSGDFLIESVENSTDSLTKEQEGIRAASEAWMEYKTEIEELCTAYDEAYESALESFQGQFGLFDEASMESEEYMNATVANAQKALESQLAYWTEYGNNIEVLKSTSAKDLGITQENYDALMSYVQSGSEEAAGLAASMVSELENGHTESVATLANTIGDVNSKQSEIAATTAEWVTDFSSKLDDLEEKMNQTIDNMDLSPEANKAATATMNNYTNALRTGGEKAVAAAQIVANQISSILSSINTTVNIGLNASGSIKSVQKNAKGTTNAEDVFIAGEEGPELIIGKAGSTVFPTSETNKIVSAVSALDGIYKSPYSESITYGDNHILENSYNYDTDYDNSRIIETVTNYGDTIKNVEENYMPSTDVSQTLQDSVISVFIPRLEMIQSILQKSLSDNLSGIEACNNAPDISVAYTVDQSLPEYIPGEQDNRILSPENDNRIVGVNEDEASVMESQMERSSEDSGTSENVKRIVIEIAGNGQIDITDGVDKQQVLDILQDNLKPVLMNIIQSEIYEEGELSYDY